MAARRASYSAMDSFRLPKLPAGCCMALSSTSPSVIDVAPTVATTSVPVCARVACCAELEQATRNRGTARNRRFAMSMGQYTVPRASWLVARGSWLVARGWGCAVAEIATTSPQGCGASGSASTRETDRPTIVSGLRRATPSDMAVVKTYRELKVWQAGMDLVEVVYAVTRTFPRDELFGLTAQARRAAISVPLNIAEGACRRTTGAFLNHVSIALGSHAELETCLEIAMRLKYMPSVGTE